MAWNSARTWKCRPSELYHIDDEFAAFCFDSAVATFGQALESELQAVEGKKKQEIEAKQIRLIQKWIPEFQEAGTPKFRDPREKMNSVQL